MDQQVASSPVLTRIYYSIAELSESVIQRWRVLEDNAFGNNVYMSPDFVIPAIRYLTPDVNIVIIAIEEYDNERPRMIALGVFETKKGVRHYPFSFLRAYQCKHSFLSGVLLDKCRPDIAMHALLAAIKKSRRWRAVQFNGRPIDKLGEKAINEVLRENGIKWHPSEAQSRAILVPAKSGAGYLDRTLTGRKKKTFVRRRRQLENLGRLEWRFIQDEDLIMQAAEDFIRLENSGWKRQKNSSIASQSSDMEFFMTIAANFAARRKIFFTEFRLDGEVISSTCNFISGSAGFAFKLGWDIRFAKQGLGFLSEYELVKRAPEVIPHLEFVDSGTLPGSYLEVLWRENRVLCSGFYSLCPVISLYLTMVGVFRGIRRRVIRRRSCCSFVSWVA